MYEDYKDYVEAPQQVIPIDMLDLWRRYSINIRTGCVYDMITGEYVLPYNGDDDELYIDLESDSEGKVTCQLSSLIIIMIYGRTNSGALEACTTFPCNPASMSPNINTFENHGSSLIINGITYRRWRMSFYYANEYGAVFSLKMFQWLRLNYNERYYVMTNLKNIGEGIPRNQRIHRIVWESFNGIIPDDLEIDHIDGRRYHNYLENLQLLTHLENLNKINPERYSYVNKEDLEAMCNMFRQNVPTRKIAKLYNLTEIFTWKIRTGRIFADITESLGYFPEVDGKAKRQFTADQIRSIRERYASGEKLRDIAKAFATSKSLINDIAKRRCYTDVA